MQSVVHMTKHEYLSPPLSIDKVLRFWQAGHCGPPSGSHQQGTPYRSSLAANRTPMGSWHQTGTPMGSWAKAT